jgi:outer membrane lipoprotein LolB
MVLAGAAGRSRRVLLSGLIASLIAGLAACSTLPSGQASTSATPASSAPSAPAVMTGRLALRVGPTADRPGQSLSGLFELGGTDREGRLRLLSPLGTVQAEAQWEPGRVRLTTPNGPIEFDSLASLSEQMLGEALPLAAWPDWLAGRAWPEALALRNDTGFSQLGWQIDLVALDSEGLLTARRDGVPSILLTIRLDH